MQQPGGRLGAPPGAAGVVVAEVGTLAQALDSELTRSRDLVVQLGEGEHPLRAVGSPIKFEGFVPHYGLPPLLDEHHDEVLGKAPPDARAAGPACVGQGADGAGQRRRGRSAAAATAAHARAPCAAHRPHRRAGRGQEHAGRPPRAARAREQRIGVLAIDPTSPKSGGAILGDRIRMDELDGSAELYIRSIGSRSTSDGLTDNLPEMLDLMDAHGFDEVLLETVGVGQAEYAARVQVDTLVLVLLPDSGDIVQAMKAGIMEMADIFVVNKSDLPGAQKMATDIKRISAMARYAEGDWRPTVLLASATQPDSIAALSAEIDRHQAWFAQAQRRDTLVQERARYRLRRLIERRTAEVVAGFDAQALDAPLRDQLRRAVQAIAADE